MTSSPADTILFRPNKKRKIYRQRAEAEDDEPPTTAATTSPTAAPAQSIDELIATSSTSDAAPRGTEHGEAQGTTVSVAEILRLRKQRKPRLGGVEFRTEGHIARDEEGALVVRAGAAQAGEVQKEAGAARVRTFAPQTGTVGDVNKHMMAYIDSELAKRRFEGVQAVRKATSTSTSASDGAGKGVVLQGENSKDLDAQRQPAALGKLLEIDLGDEARSRNVERTNQARRRLEGEEVEEDSATGGKPGKVRLGKDGKPWRGRKRRGSEDVKRDQLVEEVLRENRLEIYDEPPVESPVINDDQAADDLIAEAFRKEFMDAVSARQRKKAAPTQPPSRTTGGKKEEEVMKGPKLGGSRSARAAMRETMLKSGKK